MEIILKGHVVSGGKTKGTALVSREPISFHGGVNADSGVVIEISHCIEGENITDKVLVFPKGKGSTCGTMAIYELSCTGKAPKAIVNNFTNPVIAAGVLMSHIPAMDQVEPDPVNVIKTGDIVEIDADKGIIKVWTKSA